MSSLYNAKDFYVKVPPLPADADDRSSAFSGEDKQIIIVGGGAAGLFAAYTLEFLGVQNYVILEASAKVGGRCCASNKISDEFALDLGAEWCHYNPRVMQDLLLFPSSVNIDMIPFRPETYTFLNKSGKRVNRDFMRYLYSEFKFKNTTWEQYLRDYVVSHLDETKIHTNTVVTKVSADGKVTTSDGKVWQGDKVIVAVSLGVLQQKLIQFSPALPQQEALDSAKWADGFKVFFEFKKHFYTDIMADFELTKFDAEDFVVFYDGVLKKGTEKCIVGCACVGTHGESKELAGMDEEQLIQLLLSKLDRVYDGQASAKYIRHVMMNWTKHPTVRGAYSHETNAALIRQISEPMDDTIFFGGEHLSVEYTGYVHGAAITGRLAALAAIGCQEKVSGCQESGCTVS